MRRSRRFLFVYALANAGGVVAYLPLLTVLLPIKVELIAPEARLGWLTAMTLGGAVAASLSNILFGRLSDRSVAAGRSRRGWMWVGLAATIASYAAIGLARHPIALTAAVAAFQLAVNAMLAPLVATMADEVPDAQKGVAGGLLALASPVASAVAALVVAIGGPAEAGRLALVCLAFTFLILPLLLAPASPVASAAVEAAPRPPDRRDFAFAWTARLLIQTAGAVLFAFVLFYFQSVAPGLPAERSAARVSTLMAVSFAVSFPLSMAAGVASDRLRARKPFLVAAAVVTAAGLAVMAEARAWTPAAAGFALFASGSAVFIGLNAAFAMQLLPSARRRGRDLGLLNLANTLPLLIGPALTWLLATPDSFRTLFLVLAACALAAGGAVLPIRHRR